MKRTTQFSPALERMIEERRYFTFTEGMARVYLRCVVSALERNCRAEDVLSKFGGTLQLWRGRKGALKNTPNNTRHRLEALGLIKMRGGKLLVLIDADALPSYELDYEGDELI